MYEIIGYAYQKFDPIHVVQYVVQYTYVVHYDIRLLFINQPSYAPTIEKLP